MHLRTDDDIYRARLTYLGPPGYTFPVHLPYGQYGLFIVLVPMFMAVHWAVTLEPPDIFPAYEIALAMIGTSVIFRYVDADRPPRKVIHTALTDWRRSRTDAEDRRTPRLSARKVKIREEIIREEIIRDTSARTRRVDSGTAPAAITAACRPRRSPPAITSGREARRGSRELVHQTADPGDSDR